MKQYESYKDSGIEWLGKIPSHWNSMPIKYILGKSKNNLRVGPFGSALSGDDFQNDGYWVYNQRTVLDNNFMSADAFISKEKYEALHSFAVEAGDILITTRGTIGKIAIVPNNFAPGILHPCIIKFRVDENLIDKIFLKYIFNDCNIISDQVRLNSNSTTIDVIYSYTLKELQVPLPSLSEQQAIVSYLNYKVGQIDAAITEKEKMLEDLKAYRSAIISEAVTKGLDKNVEMKDSGIEWLGMIPKHWKKQKIKYLSNLLSGSNLVSEQILEGGKFPVYGGNGIRGYYNDYNTEGIHVLIGRQGALCGNINVATGKFWATEHAVVCYPIIDYNVEWFAALLETMNLNQYSQSAAQPGLSVEKIKNLFIPVPPKNEQNTIGTYLTHKDSQIYQSIHELQSQIDELKAYRSSVITEAVTGKVNLRNWRSNNDKK